jgi:hypothetical protein
MRKFLTYLSPESPVGPAMGGVLFAICMFAVGFLLAPWVIKYYEAYYKWVRP